MKQYHEILNELYKTVDKIEGYQKKAEELQLLIGNKATENNETLEVQNEKLEQLRLKVEGYIDEYNDAFKKVVSGVSEEFKVSTTQSIETIKNEISSETSKLINDVTKSLSEVYGNLNKERLELIEKLEITLSHNKNESTIVKEIENEIKVQNEYLSKINFESKEYIEQYKEEIETLKEELDILKENFDLKYVYDKKRIAVTSIYSFITIIMISISMVTAFYMMAYYTRLIFFPQRMHTLIIAIALFILSLGLLSQLLLIIFRPPTFLKTIKKRKIKK